MACYHPLHLTRRADGKLKKCHAGPAFADLTVACGQCSGCRLERSRQWATRLMHEATLHKKNCFLTLTYNAGHLPRDNSLDIRDWQKFAKRVRNELVARYPDHKSKRTFRFYHVGEYGSQSSKETPYGRPHYHACIFGQDWLEDAELLKKNQHGDPLWRSPSLESLWSDDQGPIGLHAIGHLSWQSAAYVARYVMKKRTGPSAHRWYNEIDYYTGEVTHERSPEYATMSRRPGLGKGWLDKFMSDVFPSDEVIVNGAKQRPPRYYDNQLQVADLELHDAIKLQRVNKAAKYAANNTPERLKVREEVQNARTENLKRN